MMHMCRSMFPQILEVPGELPKILEEHVAESRHLADVIKNDQIEGQFKAMVFSFFDERKLPKIQTNKSAIELMSEAGYILYPECLTEEDIQAFKKYYAPGEELCTFKDGRLDDCRVWFAVKKNVDEIKREDFDNPERQDEYGTSVISIQFEKGLNHTLSIKNRYNDTVSNPDNTFNSDLENIIPGLTNAFERDYGPVKTGQGYIYINNFVYVDGKYYHCNKRINGIYYCDNNVIIDYGRVIELDPNKELLMDYFIVDFQNKTIKLCDKGLNDSFVDSFGKIKNITKQGDTVTVMVEDGEDITIKLDGKNNIIALSNPNVESCGEDFLCHNHSLTELNLPKLKDCGDYFLSGNRSLTELNLSSLERCGGHFLENNISLTELNLPRLESCGDDFLSINNSLTELNLPSLERCGSWFLENNNSLTELSLPKLKRCGGSFLKNNNSLTELSLPSLVKCDDWFLNKNKLLKELNLPNLESCGYSFLSSNRSLTELNLPRLESCGSCFLNKNELLTELNLPRLESCGDEFLYKNELLTELNLPKLKSHRLDFLSSLCSMFNISDGDLKKIQSALKNKYGGTPQSGE